MATWHLIELENALRLNLIQVSKKREGDNFTIAETWDLLLPSGQTACIDFEGLHVQAVLPVELAHGVVDHDDLTNGLYIPKKQPRDSKLNSLQKWEDDLDLFVSRLVGG